MKDYYLRCRQSRLSVLIERGIRMGAIAFDEGNSPYATNGGCWDYVGYKYPDATEEAQGEPLGGADPFVHINLRTPLDLKEAAVQLAMSGDTDIATGLAEIANYFITDAEGNAVAPEFPLRVFL